jgi:hypothetical protein
MLRLRQLFSLFLAFSVLTASTGYTLTEHICKFTGQVKTMSVEKVCCKPSNKKHKPYGCCKTQQKIVKVKTPSSVKALGFKLQAFAALLPIAGFADFHFSLATEETVFVASGTSPPPLSGRQILLRKQSFLI